MENQPGHQSASFRARHKILIIAIIVILIIIILAFFIWRGTSAGPSSTYITGRDQLGGGDYKQISNTTDQSCKLACLADPVCTAWAWATPNHPTASVRNECFLKNGVPVANANVNVNSGVITRQKTQ